MKITCPECKELFPFDANDYDEGDTLECPECSIDLVLKVARGNFKAVTDKERYYSSEMEELFEED